MMLGARRVELERRENRLYATLCSAMLRGRLEGASWCDASTWKQSIGSEFPMRICVAVVKAKELKILKARPGVGTLGRTGTRGAHVEYMIDSERLGGLPDFVF